MDTDYDVKEALADYAHEAWSGWMRYLFEVSQAQPGGSVRIPGALVDRWQRQMTTPYAQLPEEEKESDRVQGRRILAIVQGKNTGPRPNLGPGGAAEIWLARMVNRCCRDADTWFTPNRTRSPWGHAVFEWWDDPRKLTVYFKPSEISYVRAWDDDLNMMDDGRIESDEDFDRLWHWLNGGA